MLLWPSQSFNNSPLSHIREALLLWLAPVFQNSELTVLSSLLIKLIWLTIMNCIFFTFSICLESFKKSCQRVILHLSWKLTNVSKVKYILYYYLFWRGICKHKKQNNGKEEGCRLQCKCRFDVSIYIHLFSKVSGLQRSFATRKSNRKFCGLNFLNFIKH